MKSMRTYLFLAFLLCCLPSSAQRRLVVVDVETSVPVDGANVVGSSFSAQTDTLGRIVVADSCRSLLFSHVNYEGRLVNLEEVRDTVFLISKLLNLKEVVVFGQAPYEEKYKGLKNQMVPSKTDLQLAATQPGNGLNILGLINYIIPKKWKKRRKERRKEHLKHIIDEY